MLIERRLNAFDLAISWALCCSRTKEQPECALNSCDWDGEDNGKKKKKKAKSKKKATKNNSGTLKKTPKIHRFSYLYTEDYSRDNVCLPAALWVWGVTAALHEHPASSWNHISAFLSCSECPGHPGLVLKWRSVALPVLGGLEVRGPWGTFQPTSNPTQSPFCDSVVLFTDLINICEPPFQLHPGPVELLLLVPRPVVPQGSPVLMAREHCASSALL